MNVTRLALAAVVAWVVDSAYGFVVYLSMLTGQMATFPGVFRPSAAMNANMPLMLAGSLIGFFALAWVYAKGYEGRNGLAEGLRFGIAMGVFVTGFASVAMYGTLNIGRGLGLYMACASFVEMIVVGVVIGLVYRGVAQTRPAGVMAA